jgi:hypothetical protein
MCASSRIERAARKRSRATSISRTGALPARGLFAGRYIMPLSRNSLMLIVGALIVAVGVLGYMLYDAKKEPTGVQINVGPGGVTIEKK